MTTQNETQDEKTNLLEQIARDVKSIDKNVEELLEQIEEYRENNNQN